MRAAREPASLIPTAQRPPHRWWNRSRPPRHRQRLPVALQDPHHRSVTPQPPRGLGRQRRPTGHVTALAHPLRHQRGRIDVHDQLTPLTAAGGRAGAGRLVHRRSSHRHQRIRPACRHRRPRERVLLLRLLLERLERLHHHSALRRGQPRLQSQRPIVVPAPFQVALIVRSLRRVERRRKCARVAAHQLLQLRTGRMPRDLHQPGFGLRHGHPAERPDLAIRQLATGKRRPCHRQLPETMRDAHVLARCDQPDRASPRQPMRTRLHAPFGPPAPVVELGNELEPAARRHRDVRSQLTDHALQRLERRDRRHLRLHDLDGGINSRTHVR